MPTFVHTVVVLDCFHQENGSDSDGMNNQHTHLIAINLGLVATFMCGLVNDQVNPWCKKF